MKEATSHHTGGNPELPHAPHHPHQQDNRYPHQQQHRNPWTLDFLNNGHESGPEAGSTTNHDIVELARSADDIATAAAASSQDSGGDEPSAAAKSSEESAAAKKKVARTTSHDDEHDDESISLEKDGNDNSAVGEKRRATSPPMADGLSLFSPRPPAYFHPPLALPKVPKQEITERPDSRQSSTYHEKAMSPGAGSGIGIGGSSGGDELLLPPPLLPPSPFRGLASPFLEDQGLLDPRHIIQLLTRKVG